MESVETTHIPLCRGSATRRTSTRSLAAGVGAAFATPSLCLNTFPTLSPSSRSGTPRSRLRVSRFGGSATCPRSERWQLRPGESSRLGRSATRLGAAHRNRKPPTCRRDDDHHRRHGLGRPLFSAVVLRVVLRADEPTSATFGLRMRVRSESLALDCPVVHEIEADREWTRRVRCPVTGHEEDRLICRHFHRILHRECT
jgi:hypothetical protein